MYNNPSGDISRVSVGPGILYLGATGSTPAVDVGYVRGSAVLMINREQVEVRQGSPQNIVDAFAVKEDVTFELTGIEWNLNNLAFAMGDGTTSLTGATEAIKFGSRPNVAKYALRYLHKTADGGTVEVDIWRAIGDGNIEATFNPDDLHEIKYKFKAVEQGSGNDWTGSALTDGQRLAKVVRVKA